LKIKPGIGPGEFDPGPAGPGTGRFWPGF